MPRSAAGHPRPSSSRAIPRAVVPANSVSKMHPRPSSGAEVATLRQTNTMSLAALAHRHEGNPAEAQDHHGPGGGLRHGACYRVHGQGEAGNIGSGKKFSEANSAIENGELATNSEVLTPDWASAELTGTWLTLNNSVPGTANVGWVLAVLA